MNTEKHLTLIKGEDRTEAIGHCMYEKGKWHVEFARGKSYSYNFANVLWLKNPDLLVPTEALIYHKNQLLTGIDKIFVFESYMRVCFTNGYKKVYPRHEIRVEKSCLNNPDARNSFEYLKQLAEKVSITN